jgi:hypothetical protein
MCLRPDAPRYPYEWREGPFVDACSNDGECHAVGCGDCVSAWRRDPGCAKSLVLLNFPPPPDAKPAPLTWCGCVQGRCTMFTQ